MSDETCRFVVMVEFEQKNLLNQLDQLVYEIHSHGGNELLRRVIATLKQN